MKNLKKVLALVLAVVMIMGTVAVASAKDFTDVKSDNSYANAIDVLSSIGILDGFENGEFQPDGYFTRAQAAKIVAIVHNAATNGAIKGQDAISDLYSNAQNPFVDCNGNWALPFINYCRITGLADGMTATTYAPNRRLTGVQWLKLMLTTLNFDTAKEGYTGTGWDINVLNRANEIGLTAGLPAGWKAIDNIKRGEAAQILYNALSSYLVEYGQLVKNNYSGYVWASSFISNEQVAQSGYTLFGKMGGTVVRSTDAYRRPGYTWSIGNWSKFYMDAPVASYTTAVSMCDVLKNDMGVAENSSKVVSLNGYVGGNDTGATASTTATKLRVNGNAVADTALNYFAVDGYKYTTMQLMHDQGKNCQRAPGFTNWKYKAFGGQGDLTQVFKTEDGYVITTIHTFLGEVTKLNKNGKYSHASGETAEIKFWQDMANDYPYYVENNAVAKTVTEMSFNVGTKILVQVSLKDSEVANKDNSNYVNGSVSILGAADSKTGKLTGASDSTYVESVSIDGTKYNTNCRFVLGKNNAMNIANNGKTYTFYFDTYGNVIGRVDEIITTADSYIILDRIYGEHVGGKFVIKADLHDLDGKAITDVTVAAAGSFANAVDGWDNTAFADPAVYWDGTIYTLAAHNHSDLTKALYTYKVSDSGVYTLTFAGDANTAYTAANTLYGVPYAKVEGSIAHTAKLAYLTVSPKYNLHTAGTALNAVGATYNLSVSESTKFVVVNAAGEYKSYTGYTELPALTASYVDYVDTDADGFADIVYLVGAVYAADNVTGWVLSWTPFNWANGYDLVTVYVDGEPVVVNVAHSTITTGVDANGAPLVRGLYTFLTKVDADGVTYSEVYKANETTSSFSGIAAASCSADSTALKVELIKDGVTYYETIGLTNVVIYNVKTDGTVVKADASCISEGDAIVYSSVYNKGVAPYAVLYVIDQF